MIKGNMKWCLSEHAIRIYLTWSCRYCPVCTLSPINLVSLVKVWTIKHYTECVSHTIRNTHSCTKSRCPPMRIFLVSSASLKLIKLGEGMQARLFKRLTVRSPLYLKNKWNKTSSHHRLYREGQIQSSKARSTSFFVSYRAETVFIMECGTPSQSTVYLQ